MFVFVFTQMFCSQTYRIEVFIMFMIEEIARNKNNLSEKEQGRGLTHTSLVCSNSTSI